MGLLDDAIRDHLQLKRAHGASEEEVRRLEQEALGSPRNAGEFASPQPAADVEAAVGGEEPAAVVGAPPVPTPEAPPEPPAEFAPEPADPRLDEAAPHADPEPWLDDEPASPAARPADEDVLEETPDFLQETPEHDRLWFEQKPPRGFDFEE